MLEKIKAAVGPRIGTTGLTVKKYSPEIYLTAGIGAGIASVVMIAKAHKQSDEVLEDVREDIGSVQAEIDSQNELAEMPSEDDKGIDFVSPSEARSLLTPLYGQLAREVVVLYGPGVLMGFSAIGLILASHSVQKKRNRALLSTVAMFERAFSLYRKRVVEELGTEADERFYYGAESRKITLLEKGEDGKTKKKKGDKNHIPENPEPMLYQRVWDETNPFWKPDRDMNEFRLRTTQSQMHDLLHYNGYVLLNTVYKALGFAPTPEGAVVGWSKKAPGDNFVYFGLDDDINQREGDNRWFLDFNVNGSVFEYIGE